MLIGFSDIATSNGSAHMGRFSNLPKNLGNCFDRLLVAAIMFHLQSAQTPADHVLTVLSI